MSILAPLHPGRLATATAHHTRGTCSGNRANATTWNHASHSWACNAIVTLPGNTATNIAAVAQAAN